MHLYILSYFVCAVSLTHSLRLFKPHLARYKYIINRRLHWMPLKWDSFSRETTCILETVISTVIVCVAVTSLPAPPAIKGSARRETDRPVTDPRPVVREIGRFRSLAGQSMHLYQKHVSFFWAQVTKLCYFLLSWHFYSQVKNLLNMLQIFDF